MEKKRLFELLNHYSEMEDDAAREAIVVYEQWTDEQFEQGAITQEEAWDNYFALFHECDERFFVVDRERIIAKIDTKRYEPLRSKNPDVHLLVRVRAKLFECT